MLSDYRRYRLYEILPGLLIWLTLIISLVLSFVKPLWMIYLVIIFDIYWVLRVIYFSFYLIVSWRRFRKAIKISWFKLLQEKYPHWDTYQNAVFLPLYNEGVEVVSATLDALKNSSYPAKKLFVIISGEERNKKHWDDVQAEIKKMYSNCFADLIFYTHPKGLSGEIPGKGSNIHHAEEQFKKYVDEKGWVYENIIISVFDIDTIVHPEYFAHLTYMYISHPRPTHSSFQPVTLYNNNIWDSPAVLRIMAFGTSFWMFFSLARLDHLVTFSSHSMSFKAAHDAGWHAKNIVSEDSRIFYQCWLKNQGDYEVTPLYIPVSMDTVRDESTWKSLKNLYFQQRRWAWGTENFPYLLWELRKQPTISWFKKFTILFQELEGKWSWALVPLLILIMGRIPLWVADEEVRQSALFFNTPQILLKLSILAMMGLFISTVMSMLVLPRRPKNRGAHHYAYMILQWLLLPISLIVFSSFPCIDAVTHLMFAKYLGFNVSAKKRK
jgi:hypothetical protein